MLKHKNSEIINGYQWVQYGSDRFAGSFLFGVCPAPTLSGLSTGSAHRGCRMLCRLRNKETPSGFQDMSQQLTSTYNCCFHAAVSCCCFMLFPDGKIWQDMARCPFCCVEAKPSMLDHTVLLSRREHSGGAPLKKASDGTAHCYDFGKMLLATHVGGAWMTLVHLNCYEMLDVEQKLLQNKDSHMNALGCFKSN